MIEPNLGEIERAARLLLGLGIGIWLVLQPSYSYFEWFLAICSTFLILNAITSRCYLWYWLGLSSCNNDDCTDGRTC
jgi:hypothetical protein